MKTGKLNGEASVPLYQQTMNEIKRAIESGSFAPGTKIPTEAELTKLYAVGRVTVRRAVKELVFEGYLTKQQGRGTFVNAPKMVRKLQQKNEVRSFSRVCEANGMKPGARVVSCGLVPADDDLGSLLGMERGSQLILVERVRTADGVPVMLENDYFCRNEFAFLEKERLSNASIIKIITDRSGRSPQSIGPSTLEVVRAGADIAKLLAVPVGEPLFFINVRFLDKDGRPLFLGHQYIVGSRFVFDLQSIAFMGSAL